MRSFWLNSIEAQFLMCLCRFITNAVRGRQILFNIFMWVCTVWYFSTTSTFHRRPSQDFNPNMHHVIFLSDCPYISVLSLLLLYMVSGKSTTRKLIFTYLHIGNIQYSVAMRKCNLVCVFQTVCINPTVWSSYLPMLVFVEFYSNHIKPARGLNFVRYV